MNVSNTQNKLCVIENDDALLSGPQMRELMGVSRATLSRLRCEGGGPPFIRLGHSRTAYPLGAYREWVKSQSEEI